MIVLVKRGKEFGLVINKKIETINPIQSTFSRDDDAFTALSTSALLAKSSVPYSHRRIADNYVIIKKIYRFQAVQSRITNSELQLLKKYDFNTLEFSTIKQINEELSYLKKILHKLKNNFSLAGIHLTLALSCKARE